MGQQQSQVMATLQITSLPDLTLSRPITELQSASWAHKDRPVACACNAHVWINTQALNSRTPSKARYTRHELLGGGL